MADFFLKWWAGAYSNPTPAEAALEPEVASIGLPYRFQHPVWALRYRLDFALFLPSGKGKQRIAIEVDDPSHTGKAKRAKDAQRTKKLTQKGWQVVRTTNAAVLANPRKALRDALEPVGLAHLVPFMPKELTADTQKA